MDLAGYLDKFEAVCSRCNVPYDILRGNVRDLDTECPACHAPRSVVGFRFEVAVQNWVISDKAHIDIMKQIQDGVSALFSAPDGVDVEITVKTELNIEAGPYRLIFRNPLQPRQLAIVDFPGDTDQRIMNEYSSKFGGSPELFNLATQDRSMRVFESVHQIARQLVDDARFDGVQTAQGIEWDVPKL